MTATDATTLTRTDDATATLSPLKRAFMALQDAEARLKAVEDAAREPIAIVGIGCRVPGADDPAAFWQLLSEGRDAVGPIPPGRFGGDPSLDQGVAVREAGFIGAVDGFDPMFFGIAPREANGMDPQQRLLLEVSWEALEQAGQAPHRLKGSATGVYFGLCSSDYVSLQLKTGDPALLDSHYTSGVAHSVASGRISYLLGLQGPSLTMDTACSSSLVAVHLACQALRAGDCRMALAGGANLMLSIESFIAFSQSRMLAPNGRCKTFDAAADGFGRGEGAAVVVLKRLADAQADGDHVLAIVRGSAVNQDGPSSSLTAPNGPAQEAVIRAALERSNIATSDVSYVEAHGTGTSLGDPLEVQALGNVFVPGRDRSQPLRIGSVKTNLGHLEAAAGVTGLVKVVLALQHRLLPPHLHFNNPSPHIPWAELPIEVPTTLSAWEPIRGRRIAGVSSFGFSGTNAHVVVEEAPAIAARTAPAAPAYLFALSARDGRALAVLADRYVTALADRHDKDLADICHTANVGRSHFAERATIVARSISELSTALAALSRGEAAPGLRTGRAGKRDPLRYAFLFTGQGAQYAGMARQLYKASSVFRAAFDRCAAVLSPLLPRPLNEIVFTESEGPSALDNTMFAQPALFAVEYALTEVWRSLGVTPNMLAGHSVGEYVAATVAGVFSLDDALRLIARRGTLMASLPAGGAMAAIAAPEAAIAAELAPFASSLAIAAVNGPEQTVISGSAAAVETLCRRFVERGVRCQPLTVSHAFHSPLMDPILDQFEREAATVAFGRPRLRLLSNLTGKAASTAEFTAADYWRRQLRSPVRFGDCLEALAELRPDCVVEIGPQPTLLSLVHAAGIEDAPLVPSLRKGRSDWEHLLDSVAMLYLAGADIDWRGLDDGRAASIVDLPTYPFQRQRHWFEAKPVARIPAQQRPELHPLLGARLPCATTATIYEAHLSAAAPGFIRAHRVLGTIVLPAAAYLETLIAVARQQLRTNAVVISDVAIAEAMAFSDEGAPRHIQTVCEPGPGGAATVTISALDDQKTDEDAWIPYATAKVGLEKQNVAGAAISLDQARAFCTERLDVASLYTQFADRGVDFGEEFRVMRGVWRGPGQALGECALGPDLTAQTGSYVAHPVLLDGCLQVMAAAISSERNDELYLPIGVGRYSVRRAVGVRCFSHVAVVASGGDILHANVWIFDQHGEVVAELLDVQLRRAGRDTLARLRGRRLEPYLYEIRWTQLPPVNLGPSGELEPAQLAAAAAAGIEELCAVADIAGYDAFTPRFEAVCAAFIVSAMLQLGWRPASGDVIEGEVLADRLGIAARHRRLFDRLLRILAEAGWLARDDGTWRVVRTFIDLAPRTELARLRLNCPAGAEAELELTERVASELAPALRGEREPVQLLFPDGKLDTAERLYRDAPTARVFGGLLADVVAAASSGGRPLRILEVGAGTGGVTAHVLERLSANCVEYLFTDIGPTFVARARERFARHSFMRFQVLDVERDDHVAALGDARFDIVIAANVVHATADVRRTLRRIQRMLRLGGVLAMLEATAPQRWFDLTVGLTDGWWAFSDGLRTDYATLTRDQWQELLPACGFDSIAALPAIGRTGAMALQSLLLARAKPSAKRNWLLFADKDGIGARIAERLRSRGDRCTLVYAGAFAADPETSSIDPTQAADYERLLEVLNTPDRPIHGVVHAWSIDLDVHDAFAPRGVASAMLLAKALLRKNRPPRLWIITRGGQYVGADDRALSPSQAPFWGLARSIAIEHPELACVAIDLGSDSAGSAQLDDLLGTLLSPGGENQIALHDGVRLAPRIARRRLPSRAVPVSRMPWRLISDGSGTLDGLSRAPLSRDQPALGEVEIEVEASALNFKDVLNALGLYPGEAGPLGGECAGRITAVGAGVTHLREGDQVMAVASGSLASHVVARAELAQLLPTGVSVEDGASFPIAYLTADVCLNHFARLRPGERVLIHAGAGGVGMAAIRLAQQAGALIFATAGSAAKRELLRDMNVSHVFDSRHPGFAEKILAETTGRGVDVVLNSLSGELIDESFRALARGGRFVELGKRGIWPSEKVAALDRDIAYFIVDWGETAAQDPAVIGQRLARLADDLREGRLQPLPRHVFNVDDAAAAFRLMMQARHAGKIVLRHQPASPVAARRDGTYLVTGGLSGLGLAVARQLADRGAGRLVLIGRREPADDVVAELDTIRAGGTGVVTRALDVADVAALRSLFAEIRRSGPPLRGVVHSAGVLEDASLIQQDIGRFERVMAPKIRGASALDQLTRLDRLDWFVMFSSIAGMLGSPGQANHAATNAFLDLLAFERRRQGLPALSIDWGAWGEIGAAADDRVSDRLARQGIFTISAAQGLAAFDRLLEDGTTQAAVLSIDWTRYAASVWRGNPPATLSDVLSERAPGSVGQTASSSPRSDLRQQLADAPVGRRRSLLAVFVRERVGHALGMAAAAVDPRAPLSEFGMDSLLAVELRNMLGSALNQSLPATLLFDFPTVESLTDHLLAGLEGGETTSVPQTTAPLQPNAVEAIENLSDDEVDRLLAMRLGKGGMT